MHLNDINFWVEFLVSTVLLKIVFADWLAYRIRTLLKFLFLRTEADVIAWAHFKKRAQGDNHQHPNTKICPDDDCSKIS